MNTSIRTSDEFNVQERVKTLGLVMPTGIAFLPRNFFSAENASELLHEQHVANYRILLKHEGVQESKIDAGLESIPEASEHGISDLVAPMLFFAASEIAQNPNLITIALSVVANYATDMMKRVQRDQVSINIIVQTPDSKYTFVKYEGPAEKIKDLESLVRQCSEKAASDP